MKTALLVSTILVLALAGFQIARGQVGTTAVPFLTISPSSEANGMGGTTIAIPRFDPTASVFSPAQIGISALTTNARGGFYLTDPGVFGYALPDLSYNSWAISAGLLLNNFVKLPFRLGVGLGYNRVDFDLGTFTVTGSGGPEQIGTFESYESSSGIVLGVGLEYLVRFGFGYTFKSVNSHLSAVGTEQGQGSGEANVNAGDYSFLLDVPLVSVVEEIAGDRLLNTETVQPFLDLSGGVGWNNVGDEVTYVDAAQADPLPRTARMGIAVSGGARIGRNADWEILRAAWSREAEDILVVRKEEGTWEYQSGLGDIRFGDNVMQGEKTTNVSLRSGWQVQIGEIFTYRSGAVKASNQYDTRGYTIQIAGIFKGMTEILGSKAPDWLTFARDHVDIQYHSADYEDRTSGKDLASYSALTLSLQAWPW